MSSNKELSVSPNEVFGTKQAPTLSYMLFVHRNKLRSRCKKFVRSLNLAQTKLFITDTLISETKRHIYQQSGFGDLSILNREQLFCNRLKKKVNSMLIWKKMSPEQRKKFMMASQPIRKAMESDDNEEENCAKRQKLDDVSELMESEKVQLIKQDDQ